MINVKYKVYPWLFTFVFVFQFEITEVVEKLVFLDKAEIELIRLTYGNSSKIKLSNANNN